MRYLRLVLQIALALCVGAGTSVHAVEPVASGKSDIEYSTLEEALAALRAKPGVTFQAQDGWLVANDSDAIVIWLFTPPGHPAYPSMIKRHIVNGPGGAYMDTAIRCLASQVACDRFFGDKK
jgi:hypothetical protein